METQSRKWFIGSQHYIITNFKKTLIKFAQICLISCVVTIVGFSLVSIAQTPSPLVSKQACPHPVAGSIITNPPEIRNLNLFKLIDFTVLNVDPNRNCYLYNNQEEAPTLRVNPADGGKTIVLKLTNKLPIEKSETMAAMATNTQNTCTGEMPPKNATSLHFHGFNVSPMCGQDEVIKTVIKPNQSFEFRVKIPQKEPPGLYWYHPHIHKQSEDQVLSGLTGVLIVEGIGKFNQRAAKLPERVFVLRDMNLSKNFPTSDTDQPAKDISINSVPIRYLGDSKYDPPAVIKMQPDQEQFWRVANTAADSYFDLQVIYDQTIQKLELVGMDGVPINADDGIKDQTLPVEHILLPPGGRAEFIVKAPGQDVKDAKFMTLKYDTKADNDPERVLAKIETKALRIAESSASVPNIDLSQVSGDRFSGMKQMKPVQQRKLYFSQNDSTNEFYITEEGKTPKPYDMNATTPNITVTEGTTEDWVVENRAQEAHAFHIHQIHFLTLESTNPSEIGMLRDTINLPAWDGKSITYPKVKLRMDFRGKGSSIAGTFVYHCHILEHEDGGMMGSIQVKSKNIFN